MSVFVRMPEGVLFIAEAESGSQVMAGVIGEGGRGGEGGHHNRYLPKTFEINNYE